MLDLISRGAQGHGPVHLLLVSAAELGFAWNGGENCWVRVSLRPLRMITGPVQHFRSAILDAWRFHVFALVIRLLVILKGALVLILLILVVPGLLLSVGMLLILPWKCLSTLISGLMVAERISLLLGLSVCWCWCLWGAAEEYGDARLERCRAFLHVPGVMQTVQRAEFWGCCFSAGLLALSFGY